jgi:hypothetical protein
MLKLKLGVAGLIVCAALFSRWYHTQQPNREGAVQAAHQVITELLYRRGQAADFQPHEEVTLYPDFSASGETVLDVWGRFNPRLTDGHWNYSFSSQDIRYHTRFCWMRDRRKYGHVCTFINDSPFAGDATGLQITAEYPH